MPLIYTGPPDIVEDMKTLFRGGLPQDVASESRDDEDVEAFAEMFTLVEGETAGYSREMQISTAHGFWLYEHGRGRGLRPWDGETDEQFRIRLRLPPTAGTRDAILDALSQLLGLDDIILIELPRQSAFLSRGHGLSRGHRIGGGRGVIIALIPASSDAYGPSLALLRTKKSAGKIAMVEEYS